jgi:hypothetical protein
MDYDTIEDEIQDLIWDLHDADQDAIATHMDRLRVRAEQITDDRWRERALSRIASLPRLIGPAPLGQSPEYSEAVRLAALAHGSTGSAEQRIAFCDGIMTQIAELADRAPGAESIVIRRMNSSIARIISTDSAAVESGAVDGRSRPE